jgi:hypothetical protein
VSAWFLSRSGGSWYNEQIECKEREKGKRLHAIVANNLGSAIVLIETLSHNRKTMLVRDEGSTTTVKSEK